jgi:DNA polymerase epsilon subunit 2
MDLDPSPAPANEAEEQTSHDLHIARKLVKTILDQGYLSPFGLATRPVLWDYASALQVYPLPTAMVLADTEAPAFCVTYEGCHVMNPGSVVAPGRRGVARWVEYDIAGKVGKVREAMF